MELPSVELYGVNMTTDDSDEPATRSGSDLKKFERLPARQKELQRLKGLAEKSAGPDKANLDLEIRRRSGVDSE
jgi:hypothetical protein